MTSFKLYLPIITALVLILGQVGPANGKISWLASIAKNKLGQLREMRDKVVYRNEAQSSKSPVSTSTTTETTTAEESTAVQGRDMYGGGGGGSYGGGGGSYGMMGMMPSLETSLTTLAFLSFGAFLLSMLLRALNVTTMGRKRRDLEFEDGGIYTFSDAARIALDAVNNLVFDSKLPECTARALCKTYRNVEATEDGWLGQSPWITRTVMKWLTSETDTHYMSPKWRVFQDSLEGENCETHFSECSGNDEDIDDVYGDVREDDLKTNRQPDSKWKLYMKKVRRWDPSDWTLGPS